MIPALMLVLIVVLLATNAYAAPYQSVGEFVGDTLNSFALGASAAGAAYGYSRTMEKDMHPVAAMKAGWAFTVAYMTHSHFVVGPRIRETTKRYLGW